MHATLIQRQLLFNHISPFKKQILEIEFLRETSQVGLQKSLQSRDRVTNLYPATDESFRSARQKENRPEIEINKFIRLHRLFVLLPLLPLQTNTATHERTGAKQGLTYVH